MSWRERLGPSIPARLAARREERTFAARVERAFEPDPAALDRVRAMVVGEAAGPVRPVLVRRGPATGFVRLGLPVAAAFVLVVAAGLLAFGRPGAPTSSPSMDQSALLATDLARSAIRFHDTTVAIGAGDIATIEATLIAYRAGLLDLETELGRPGTDDAQAASDLLAQSAQLSGLVGSVPASELSLYRDVLADLDRIVAALPGGTDHPGNTDHPTPSDHPGNTDHPTPSDHPGQTDHPGNTDHPTPSNHPRNTDHPTPSNHPGNTDHPTPSNHPGNNNHPTPHPKSTGDAAGSVGMSAVMTGTGD